MIQDALDYIRKECLLLRTTYDYKTAKIYLVDIVKEAREIYDDEVIKDYGEEILKETYHIYDHD